MKEFLFFFFLLAFVSFASVDLFQKEGSEEKEKISRYEESSSNGTVVLASETLFSSVGVVRRFYEQAAASFDTFYTSKIAGKKRFKFGKAPET